MKTTISSPFNKTGSGQTRGKVELEGAFSTGPCNYKGPGDLGCSPHGAETAPLQPFLSFNRDILL